MHVLFVLNSNAELRNFQNNCKIWQSVYAVGRCVSGPHCLCPSPESGVQHGWAECCAAYSHYAPAAPAFRWSPPLPVLATESPIVLCIPAMKRKKERQTKWGSQRNNGEYQRSLSYMWAIHVRYLLQTLIFLWRFYFRDKLFFIKKWPEWVLVFTPSKQKKTSI